MAWEEEFKSNLLEVLYRADQPRHPAGSPEGGRFAPASGGGVPATGSGLSLEAEAKVRSAESEIVTSLVEIGVAFDKDGNELFRVEGSVDKIYFDDDKAMELWGEVLTHNHPTGNATFSVQDVLAAEALHLEEIRVVTDEYLCVLTKPEGGWRSFYTSPSGSGNQSLSKHISDIRLDTFVEFAQRGGPTPTDAEVYHEMWTRVSKELDISYTRTQRR